MASALLFALSGVASAAADDAPLIPDCYAANQSQAEFHDCIRGKAGAASPRSGQVGSTAPSQTWTDAKVGTARSGFDTSAPPAGMWEREHDTSSANAPSEDAYAGLPEPPPEAEGPPYMDGSRSDADAPQWGAPYSDGPDYRYGSRSPDYGPRREGWADDRDSWPDEGPPDDGPDF